MANSAEPSSSLSFTSSSQLSNGSFPNRIHPSETGLNVDSISLSKLSSNLEQLLINSSSDFDFSDADIIVEDITTGVHRCLLACRSKFFNDLFGKDKASAEKKKGKLKYCMKDLLPYGKVGYEAFNVFLGYIYTGLLKPSPREVSTCVDNVCGHNACRPAINFAVELMYASSIFQVPELVSLFQRRLLNLVDKAAIEDVVPILEVAFYCQLTQLLAKCVHRVAQSDLEPISLEKELPFQLTEQIRTLRLKSKPEHDQNPEPVDPVQEKRIRRLLKALDSDDVELVRMLLTESDMTLDEAYALHYAVSYCDPKIVSEVLSLGMADVNLRNSRGYTVLHVAAMRKEPKVIVSLLTKGACALDKTLDGRDALSICRRLTRLKDYRAETVHGQESNKDRVCIEVLEREISWNNPMSVDASFCPFTMTDDLNNKLHYLEERVAFAQMLFPTEAKLAMEIAHAEVTSGLASLLASKGSSDNLREVDLDLNETPIAQLHSKIETLSRTVELGRRYFPHCSKVLDKFMEDDLDVVFYLEKGTTEEQRMNRMRFMELKEEVQRAFTKDKAELHRIGFASSASSPSTKDGVKQHKLRKL